MNLRCLVVDDESLGRKLVEENIHQIPFLDLVASCKNAYEAMEILQREPIDLMFLDIQMPGMLGTSLVSSLRNPPMVILVTAYSNYAVESYDLDVIDYLLKPVSIERFTKAVYKALEHKQKTTKPASEPREPTVVTEEADHFFVNVEYSLVKVTIKDITHIEGMKDYVKIFTTTSKKPILTKTTLKNLEEKLENKGFMRVHKSYIINIAKIDSIRSHQVFIGDHEIPVSEVNLETLMKELNFNRL
ncbi:MAG: response regulator transcription factor [Saprospiraceae bacterium]|nr:response regulator transcription factor [Saprospiraceae bacterium]